MNWQQLQVNLYSDHNGGTKWGEAGQVRTLRQVLFSDFGDNISDILKLRNLDRTATDYDSEKKKIKKRLQCHTTAAQLSTREKETPEADRIIKKTGLTQIDIDHVEAQGFDIDELKQFLFYFPFTCFVSVSCSGDGIFAIMAIAEPDKLAAYTEHVHNILIDNGIKVDTGKGKNYSDLRYVSYDQNMLWRDEVEPLRIKHFKPVLEPKRIPRTKPKKESFSGNNPIKTGLDLVRNAEKGNRWPTVRDVGYCFGGLNDKQALQSLIDTINSSSQFSGYEDHCIKQAYQAFEAGQKKPFEKKLAS